MLLVSFDGLKEKCRRIAMESCKEIMAEIGNLHAEDLQVDYEIRQGKLEQVIAETAGKLGNDLIVICTDGKDNIKNFLTGKITEHVINHASCPLLVIPYQKNA
jgi:nucleotide-binding universal stress UspA family protein